MIIELKDNRLFLIPDEGKVLVLAETLIPQEDGTIQPLELTRVSLADGVNEAWIQENFIEHDKIESEY